MPNCYHFSTSFITLLLNNFSSLKSLGNCELDDSIGALDNLKQFLTGQNDVIRNDDPLNLGLDTFSVEFSKPYTSIIGEMTIGYVAGYITRILIKSTNNCNICKYDCIDIHNKNELIKTINNMCNKPNIFKKLNLLIESNVDFNFICKTHNLKQILIQKISWYLLLYLLLFFI